MFHLGAFYQSVNPAGVLTNIAAVPDQSLYINGNDMRVPAGLANLLAEAALTAATGPAYAQVQSPTLRNLANQDVLPLIAAVTFSSYDSWQNHAMSPRDLAAAEALNFAIQATGGAAAANYGLVWLGDGPIKPTTGKIFSIRATAAAALSAGAWVNSPVTFDTVLPAGSYQVVGLYVQGANLVAARLVFPGNTFRPGVAANSSLAQNLFPTVRRGLFGVFGEFDINQPPTVDCLGVTDTAQVLVFDLIKTK